MHANDRLAHVRRHKAELREIERLTSEGERLYRAGHLLEAQVIWGYALSLSPGNHVLYAWIEKAKSEHKSELAALRTSIRVPNQETAIPGGGNIGDDSARTAPGTLPEIYPPDLTRFTSAPDLNWPNDSNEDVGQQTIAGNASQAVPATQAPDSLTGSTTRGSRSRGSGGSAEGTGWTCSECRQSIGQTDMETYFRTSRCNHCEYNW